MTEENNDSNENGTGSTDLMAEMAEAMEAEQEEKKAGTGGTDAMAEMAAAMEAEQEEKASEEVEFPEQNAEAIAKEISGKDVNIETLLKVPVSLAIEVGRTQMTLSDLLDTQEGSVIELERLLDDPLDILVNGALIAHGVVVLANETFGIQITDIISLQDRARSL